MISTPLSPWTVADSDFPRTGMAVDKLRFCVNYAVLAPSTHNAQPWLFKVKPKEIEVYADRTRALPVVDPDDRELVISCGCAIYQLRLALRHFGFQDDVTLLPDDEDEDLMAVIRVTGSHQPTPEEERLFAAIPKRHTNRHRFEDEEVDEGLVAELVQAAEAEGSQFIPILGEKRNALADLIAEADQRQMADKRFRRELAAWIHPKRRYSGDGMPAFAPGVSDVVTAGGPFVLRTFEFPDTQASLDYRIAVGSPLLAVLSTDGDTPRDWLRAGMGLAHLLLRSAEASVWASYLNQPVEVPLLRPLVAEIAGGGASPQLILRMGVGPAAKPTPRRPLEEVLI